MASKVKRHLRLGSTLDDFLKTEGVLEEFRATAIKEVIAWQLQKAMTDQKLSKNKMAELMHTSDSAPGRGVTRRHGPSR